MIDITHHIDKNTLLVAGIILIIVLLLYLIQKFTNEKGVIISNSNKEDLEIEKTEVNIGKSYSNNFNLDFKDFSKFCLIFGSTGSGKTVTIKNIVSKFITANYPVIYVDGKPSDSVVNFLDSKAHNKFYGFNCHNNYGYDFLRGTPSEVKDRIICIKDQWESDYYKTVSSDYIQLVLRFLIESESQITLNSILQLLNIKEFLKVLRNSKSELIHKVVYFADNVKESELKGLYSHLSLVLNSDFGCFLDGSNEDAINLEEVINSNAVAYFALPALKFPEFSSFIGKVVINDIKSTIEKVRKPVLIIFDEFSVFAGSQVLNLINQGREFGAHTIVGTQSVEDLKEWSS